MKNGAVIAVVAALAVGAGAGLLWAKLKRAQIAELEQQLQHQPAADPGTAANPGPAAEPSAQLPEEKLRALNAGDATPGPSPAAASPADPRRRAEVRQKLMLIHPDFAEQLQLTPEEAERFFDLLARQQLQTAELIAARQGGDRGAYSQALLSDLRTMALADDAEQAALLGGKFPDWLQHQEAELQQNPLDKLQGVLARQGIGLAGGRVEQLAEALTAEQKRLSQNLPRVAESHGNDPRQQLQRELQYASDNRQQLLKVASGYLDAQQLDTYGQLLAERARTAQRLLRKMQDETGD